MNTEKTLKVIEILTDRINDLETSLERYYGAYKALNETNENLKLQNEELKLQLEELKKSKENKGGNK